MITETSSFLKQFGNHRTGIAENNSKMIKFSSVILLCVMGIYKQFFGVLPQVFMKPNAKHLCSFATRLSSNPSEERIPGCLLISSYMSQANNSRTMPNATFVDTTSAFSVLFIVYPLSDCNVWRHLQQKEACPHHLLWEEGTEHSVWHPPMWYLTPSKRIMTVPEPMKMQIVLW